MQHVYCIGCWGPRARGSRRGRCGGRRGPSSQLQFQCCPPGVDTLQACLAHPCDCANRHCSQVADRTGQTGPYANELTPVTPGVQFAELSVDRLLALPLRLHGLCIACTRQCETCNREPHRQRHAHMMSCAMHQCNCFCTAMHGHFTSPYNGVPNRGTRVSLRTSSRAFVHHMLLRSSFDKHFPPWTDESPRVAYSAACASMWKRRLAVVLNDSNFPMRTRRAFCRAPLPVNRPCSGTPAVICLAEVHSRWSRHLLNASVCIVSSHNTNLRVKPGDQLIHCSVGLCADQHLQGAGRVVWLRHYRNLLHGRQVCAPAWAQLSEVLQHSSQTGFPKTTSMPTCTLRTRPNVTKHRKHVCTLYEASAVKVPAQLACRHPAMMPDRQTDHWALLWRQVQK